MHKFGFKSDFSFRMNEWRDFQCYGVFEEEGEASTHIIVGFVISHLDGTNSHFSVILVLPLLHSIPFDLILYAKDIWNLVHAKELHHTFDDVLISIQTTHRVRARYSTNLHTKERNSIPNSSEHIENVIYYTIKCYLKFNFSYHLKSTSLCELR